MDFDRRVLDRQVEGCAQSHQLLLEVVDTLTDEQCREPSLLPKWSRGHLLSHLARNAESHAHLLECAERGEIAEQYPGGPVARENGIQSHAHDSARELVAALRASIYSLEGTWARASAVAWQGSGRQATGNIIPLADIVFLRWRECVIHLTDLDVGIGPDKWPALYVRMELDRQEKLWASRQPMGLTTLPDAAKQLPDATRLAWLVGRAHPEGLPEGPGL